MSPIAVPGLALFLERVQAVFTEAEATSDVVLGSLIGSNELAALELAAVCSEFFRLPVVDLPVSPETTLQELYSNLIISAVSIRLR